MCSDINENSEINKSNFHNESKLIINIVKALVIFISLISLNFEANTNNLFIAIFVISFGSFADYLCEMIQYFNYRDYIDCSNCYTIYLVFILATTIIFTGISIKCSIDYVDINFEINENLKKRVSELNLELENYKGNIELYLKQVSELQAISSPEKEKNQNDIEENQNDIKENQNDIEENQNNSDTEKNIDDVQEDINAIQNALDKLKQFSDFEKTSAELIYFDEEGLENSFLIKTINVWHWLLFLLVVFRIIDVKLCLNKVIEKNRQSSSNS